MKKNLIILSSTVLICGFFILSCNKTSTPEVTKEGLLGVGDEALPYTNPTWMSHIPDSLYLYQISIPGTHDAAADQHTSQQGTADAYVVCQDFYIANQMLIGVRWFDIRLNLSGGVLTAHHSAYYLHKNFNDLLTAGLDFLENYPSETLIYMIKQEHSSASQDDFTHAVYTYLTGRSSDLSKFYLGHDMPKLEQVRGKIVIMTREGCTSAYENERGMYLYWDDNTSGGNFDACDYPLWVQDHYSLNTVPYGTKIEEIESGIYYAENAHNNRLYINFTSGEQDVDLVPVWIVTSMINPAIQTFLNENLSWHSLGVIMLNYAGGSDYQEVPGQRSLNPELVDMIIHHNILGPAIVKIGTQTWMKDNLCVTHYRNGDPITEITDSTQWSNLATGGFCSYNNNPDDTATYGQLYNWYAVNDPRGLCPNGWHVPSDAEWTTMISFLGGTSLAGGSLKETGTHHWKSPNGGATNKSWFTALPGGYRDDISQFGDLGGGGYWWSATSSGTYSALGRGIGFSDGSINPLDLGTNFGLSVRCIKD